MRSVLVLLGAVVFGAAAGVASAGLKLWLAPWKDPSADARRVLAAPADPKALLPKAVCDKPNYLFGTMDALGKGRHEFVVRNAGMAPLTINKGPATCNCVLADFDPMTIAPGQSAVVAVEWSAKGRLGAYHQSASVLTNDPDNPRLLLSVSGRVLATVEVVPTEVVFSQLMAGEASTAEVRVYLTRPGGLKIVGYELEDPATAGQFQVGWRPLSAEELKARPEAQSGQRVEITAKSGLPLGTIRQTIRLKTDLADVPHVEVPVLGVVASDIALFGPGWNAEENVLSLGVVRGEEGLKRSLVLVARGRQRDEVRLRVKSVSPPFLKVALGETTPMGAATRTPLTVEVPPRTPPGSYLGSSGQPEGFIEIETGHPRVPLLRLRVSLSVEG